MSRALAVGLAAAAGVFVGLQARVNARLGNTGLSALTAIVVSGQLAIAVVVDGFGLLGIAKQQIALHRIVGLVLLLVGAVLVVHR
jgi:transporter family-2 protein